MEDKTTKRRGRPIGSTKLKAVNNGGAFNIKLEKHVEETPITRKSGFDYVNWGLKNDYPKLLLDLYAQSPTHSAAINFGVQSILGDGVDYEASNFDANEVTPNYYQNWEELIRAISLDYMIFGSYAVQIIMNKDGKTLSYFHMPLDRVRWGEYDEDGQITEYWISNDWSATGQNPPFRIDAFDMREDAQIKKGIPYLYVYRPYSPTMTYYTQPHYSPGIKAIQAEIEAIQFDLKTTVNNFVPAGMIVLDDLENDEEKKAVIDNVSRMFTSADNANSVMITFRRNIEQQAPSFVPFTANSGNVNLYDSLGQRAVNRILAAHQINDPQLIGLPNVGGSGFNSEGQLLETAYNVYNKVVGNYNRQNVIKTFNFMLKLNGVDTELIMKPLRFNDIQTGDSTKSDEETKETGGNAEEKQDGNNVKEEQ